MRLDVVGSGEGVYPERAQVREAFADRLVGRIGFRLHTLFARGPHDPSLLIAEVREHVTRFASGLLAPRVPDLRYQLRRRGLQAAVVPEVLAMYAAACGVLPAPEILGAASAMLRRRVVDLPNPVQQRQAAAFAASAFALCGIPVKVIVASDASARRSAQAMQEPMAALGLSVGCVAAGMDLTARREAYRADVVCAGYREIGNDYLRDRMMLGGQRRPIHSALEHIAGDAPPDDRLWLRGLQCAVVEDADLVLIDDARVPLMISAESDHSQERLLYEQAIELARALDEEADFFSDEEGVRMTATGSGRLARLTQPLGGIWGAQHRREELICEALTALHYVTRDRDYQVAGGRVVFPAPGPEQQGDVPPADATLQRLIEVKEGLKLAGKRDVLGRVSVPRFFQRCLFLCGVCADAVGLEGEFWTMYRLKTERAALPAPPPRFGARVFATGEHLQRALQQAVSEAAGQPLVVAFRTPAAAKAAMAALASAGLQPGLLRGADDEQERAALKAVRTPGALTVALSPAERSVALEGPPVLRLIVVEPPDSLRHLARLQRAYAARNCDVWFCLADEAISNQLDLPGQAVAAMIQEDKGELPSGRAMWLVRRIQRRIEQAHVGVRRDVMMTDQYLGDLMAYSGTRD
jgi:preprotein translocase subunit SecA